MAYGHRNTVYDVALADRHVIVRTNTELQVLAGTEHTMAALAEQIVCFQRLVATLPAGTGYGWVPLGQRGPYPSWDAVIQDKLVTYMAAVRDVLPAGIIGQFTCLYGRFQPYLAPIPPICFLDDTTTKNVIMPDGRLQGLVDFDWVAYGDPLYPLGLVRMAVTADAPSGRFYFEELCRLWPVTPFQRAVVNFYSALFALDFLDYRRQHMSPTKGIDELAVINWFLAGL